MSKITTITEQTRSKENPVYIDINSNFDRNAVTGEVSKKINVESVKQSVKFLLLTSPMERPFQPTIGGGLNKLLFENVDSGLQIRVEQMIKTTLTNHEPRAEYLGSKISFQPDRNGASITVNFMIKRLREEVSIDAFIERTR